MKYIAPACFIYFFTLLLISCTKDNGTNISTGITGKWSIVADSTYTGVGIANHVVIYNGKTDDYCNFKTNGFVDIKEGMSLNTLHYQVIGDSTIFIESFYGSPGDTSRIEKPGINNILITTYFFPTPGGTFGRTLHLTR